MLVRTSLLSKTLGDLELRPWKLRSWTDYTKRWVKHDQKRRSSNNNSRKSSSLHICSFLQNKHSNFRKEMCIQTKRKTTFRIQVQTSCLDTTSPTSTCFLYVDFQGLAVVDHCLSAVSDVAPLVTCTDLQGTCQTCWWYQQISALKKNVNGSSICFIAGRAA